jgi:hypothetical protein
MTGVITQQGPPGDLTLADLSEMLLNWGASLLSVRRVEQRWVVALSLPGAEISSEDAELDSALKNALASARDDRFGGTDDGA